MEINKIIKASALWYGLRGLVFCDCYSNPGFRSSVSVACDKGKLKISILIFIQQKI